MLLHRPLTVSAFIALGGNLGDAAATLGQAVVQLRQCEGVQVQRCSSLYRSAPVNSSGPDYLNAVIGISTDLPAYSLLNALQKIEQMAGRTRPYLNAPRTLDLDLLLYGQAQIQSQRLIVPHPRMQERAFVLLPLHEIAPECVLPAALKAVSDQAIERIGALI